jgi:hypothetical protein
MASEQQARWMWVLGVAVAFLMVLELLRFAQSTPEPPVQQEICFVSRESGVTFGRLLIATGRSTFLLRDQEGIILEVSLEKEGRIGFRDEKGHWKALPVRAANET